MTKQFVFCGKLFKNLGKYLSIRITYIHGAPNQGCSFCYLLCFLRIKMKFSPISAIKLVVAKCWDPNPKGYFTIPRTEPVRPIDPGAWVAHTAAMRGKICWKLECCCYCLLRIISQCIVLLQVKPIRCVHLLFQL